MEALFRAYFTEGRDISDVTTLLDVVAGAGLDRSRAGAVLNGNEGLAEMRAAEDHARRIGVSGVPYFVVNNTIALSGAREPEAFWRAIRQAAASGREHRRHLPGRWHVLNTVAVVGGSLGGCSTPSPCVPSGATWTSTRSRPG